MENATLKMAQAFQQSGGHTLYFSSDLENYIQNAAVYIVSGIERGEQVLFVENDRRQALILEKVKQCLNSKQLQNLHFINNFDFYWQHGDFHPTTVISVFSNKLRSLTQNNQPIRTRGHVEWNDDKQIHKKLEEFEQVAGHAVSAARMLSVCAYDAERVPESLKAALMRTHEFFMTDNEFIRL
ncbi:MEDS domain-containing protein [Domibacillus indicus]|uniref:MEDS domain-containing protein n=1 Tax=Domibacillus indicus TaxID=1437523 RepID=UPI0018CE9C76|nr:MEDS domain-containing protein [Domibacillus indicus]